MRPVLHRRPKFIIAVSAVLYAVALAIAWHAGTMRAERRVVTMLKAAETGYAATINGEIEAALRNAGGAIIGLMKGECKPLPLGHMQEIARTFNIDEINVVNRDGVIVGSNLENLLGMDFKAEPWTREFMSLTNPAVNMVSQPFRQGVGNPEFYGKYYGMPFPRHDGFLQLGMSLDRLRQNMYAYTEEEARDLLREWHFSVEGWYERVDDADAGFEAGKIVRGWNEWARKPVIGRYFSYSRFRYIAYLPEAYCYAQRNTMFAVTAMLMTVFFCLFTFFLVRLTVASAKLEAMHAVADARTAADLALAKTIQMSALPTAEGAFADELSFSFMAESTPAREVGGDFYDFYAVPGGRMAFLIADVSGKGIPAAMFMMEAKNVIKNSLTAASDLAEAVAEANGHLCANNRAEMFVTAWIGVLDVKTGEMEYVNAGHNRPFVRHVDGSVVKVTGKGGRFLGMFEDAAYRSHRLKFEKGDVLYLYTDGVTEAMNAQGELFGERRLCEAFSAKRIRQSLAEFVGGAEQSDDITGMVVRWNGRPEPVVAEFPNEEASLARVVEFVRSTLSDVEGKMVAKVLNAADEIASNIVNYSGARTFSVSVERSFDRVLLEFADAGVAYNPLAHVDPDTTAAIEDRPIGGLGLVMVKKLMDRISYSRENGCNVLRVIKWIRKA